MLIDREELEKEINVMLAEIKRAATIDKSLFSKIHNSMFTITTNKVMSINDLDVRRVLTNVYGNLIIYINILAKRFKSHGITHNPNIFKQRMLCWTMQILTAFALAEDTL